MSAISYEATCSRCGETFCPSGPDDLIHVVDVNGVECGGQGVNFGAWGSSNVAHDRDEREPCERGTIGCSVRHRAGADDECATW